MAWPKGVRQSDETRAKISAALRGRRKPLFTEEHLRHLSEAHKGQASCWKGKTLPKHTREKLSEAHKGLTPWLGRRHKNSSKEKMRQAKLGRKLSIERRRRLAESLAGERSHLWRGGRTTKQKLIRSSLEYKLWRTTVFERDNYTCVWCYKKGVYLHADHIKPFASYPKLRFMVANGRTLCVDCHRKTDTYAGRTKT